jgi:hypothetical protein
MEHRLFACISQNWQGKPLVSYYETSELQGEVPMLPSRALRQTGRSTAFFNKLLASLAL